ncbi:hypothetical protein [Bifidobacterium bifidum]|uniref:hypothetical protein n=1 Tax=Bifidobacterium bifidum TaxID=1681 RepID=UPI0034A0E15E
MNRKRAEISHFQIPFIRMTAKTTNTDRHILSRHDSAGVIAMNVNARTARTA